MKVFFLFLFEYYFHEVFLLISWLSVLLLNFNFHVLFLNFWKLNFSVVNFSHCSLNIPLAYCLIPLEIEMTFSKVCCTCFYSFYHFILLLCDYVSLPLEKSSLVATTSYLRSKWASHNDEDGELCIQTGKSPGFIPELCVSWLSPEGSWDVASAVSSFLVLRLGSSIFLTSVPPLARMKNGSKTVLTF